ncbi:MAG TPA: sigma-70 family RNA polymerase sigma factor [Gammaproteobacteria bacterium]|nr:sigma-70 family RNA polymerase sigma factor [Gammaproteobacteria bacterium]
MKLIERICSSGSQRRKIAASRGRLYRVALAWCGDAMLADDLVQETLSLALQRVHQLREAERLNAWMYSILNNCWKQHLRRYRPHEDLDEERPCGGATPDVAIDRMETVLRVREAVSRLPLEQRRVLALVDLEGMAYGEVATVLEIPMGTVMSRLHRGRRALLALLENERETAPQKAVSLRRVK